MATVTGMTAAAMEAIRDNTVVNAAFDSANHLILTKYDGTQIDAGTVGAASAVLAGSVELATSAETQAGTDATRAVTPAGLASLPGYRVQIVSGLHETDSPSAWPYGTSMQSCSSGDGGGWTPHGGDGTVVTESISLLRTAQIFYENSGGTASTKAWIREYNSSVGGGGWTAWAQMLLAVRLNETSFTQLTAMATYPSGRSFLYYTTANGGSWDFSGMAGTVETMFLTDKSYATQTFTQHVAGSANTPNVWIRTSDNTTGWSAWKKLIHDPGAWVSYTPAWTTSSGTATPSFGNATISCKSFKLGRKVDVRFEVTFGSTTNFGGGGTGDNWDFSLPYTAAGTSDTIGWLQIQQSNDKICIGRARLVTATTFRTSLSAGFADGTAITNTGDMDAQSPFVFASGNSIKGQLTYESAS